MNLHEYETAAAETASPYMGVFRCTLALCEEAGEVSGKLKRAFRDHGWEGGREPLPEVTRQAMIDELGDVLWYVAILARELGTDLDTVAARNLAKLEDRQRRGVIRGSGDKR